MTKKQAIALRQETAYEVIDDPGDRAAKLWAEAKAKKIAIDTEYRNLVNQMWANHSEQVIAAEKVIAWQAKHSAADTSDNQML